MIIFHKFGEIMRVTLEEIKLLEPSVKNPIHLKCFDDEYGLDMKEVRIIGVYDDEDFLYMIDANGDVSHFAVDDLVHFTYADKTHGEGKVWFNKFYADQSTVWYFNERFPEEQFPTKPVAEFFATHAWNKQQSKVYKRDKAITKLVDMVGVLHSELPVSKQSHQVRIEVNELLNLDLLRGDLQ